MKHYDRVWATVDLDAIRNNCDNMKKNINKDTKMICVIKTDGYGHGAVPIAREMETVDYVFGFAVATAEEAMILRKAGIAKPILVLGYTFPYAYKDMIEEEIRPTVFRFDMAKELSDQAVQSGKVCKIHIKVDTGMSRIGIQPDQSGIAFVKDILPLPGLELEGIFTHFARADEIDKSAVNEQIQLFKSFTAKVENELHIQIPLKHCSNSAGIIELKEANMDVVRAGITLYGLWPSGEVRKDIVTLVPALSLKSHIVFMKKLASGKAVSYGGTFVTEEEKLIATIPVGYGDGYPRGLSNKGYILIHGQRAPIAGRVCMDQFMVDVTKISGVSEGDEVTLIGKDGNDSISIEELGEISGRFNYELACDLGKRIPRVYVKKDKIISTKDYFDDYEA